MRLAVALLTGAVCAGGCAARPHALAYVALPNHEANREDRAPLPTAEERARRAELEPEYPIFGDDPPPLVSALAAQGEGEGGAGCSPGLIGARCELGILGAEIPLDERERLPPDGRVIQAPLPGPGEPGKPRPLPAWQPWFP